MEYTEGLVAQAAVTEDTVESLCVGVQKVAIPNEQTRHAQEGFSGDVTMQHVVEQACLNLWGLHREARRVQ
jgi:hypothetical protein